MTKVLKAVGLGLAVTVLVWLLTIWRWQNNRLDVSTSDIVWQLLVLPLALTVFLLAVLWGVDKLREQAKAPITPRSGLAVGALGAAGNAGASASASQAVSDGKPDEPVSAFVLAESVTLSAGSDAAMAWSSLQAKDVRPQLDSTLQDFDGMPVFTSRVADLEVADWLDAHAELASGPRLHDSVLRGLALLEAPLHQMLMAVSELPNLSEQAGTALTPEPQATMKAHLSGVAKPVNQAMVRAHAERVPQLNVRLLLPTHWSQEDRHVAVDWVRQQCGALLDWAQSQGARAVHWLTDAVERPEQLWQEIDRLMVQWSREPRPELLLILAVDSAVHEQGIERMQAVGELFTSSHQTGKVPGEAAAGLLLANASWQTLAGKQAAPSVRMWRPVQGTRDKSADAAGRVGAAVLGAALQQAAVLSQADKDRVLVVSDADHRASRTAELFEALQEVMPGVDPMLAVTRVGESCGDLGLARTLVPSALASAALRAAEHADQVALAAHVQSSHERVVVALAPCRADELVAA